MAGPYNIPPVSYGGDTPDPVEVANGYIKPAIDDLDLRLSGTRLWPYMAVRTLTQTQPKGSRPLLRLCVV